MKDRLVLTTFGGGVGCIHVENDNYTVATILENTPDISTFTPKVINAILTAFREGKRLGAEDAVYKMTQSVRPIQIANHTHQKVVMEKT